MESWDLFVRTKWSLSAAGVYREMICHFSLRLTADHIACSAAAGSTMKAAHYHPIAN